MNCVYCTLWTSSILGVVPPALDKMQVLLQTIPHPQTRSGGALLYYMSMYVMADHNAIHSLFLGHIDHGQISLSLPCEYSTQYEAHIEIASAVKCCKIN